MPDSELHQKQNLCHYRPNPILLNSRRKAATGHNKKRYIKAHRQSLFIITIRSLEETTNDIIFVS